MPHGLDAETYVRLLARHGSLATAVQKAKADSRFEAAIREAIVRQWLTLGDREGHREATAELGQLVAAWDRLDAERPGKARHRLADTFPMATWEELDRLLAARRPGRAIDAELTHEAIAKRLSALPPRLRFSRTRVQRAEEVRTMVFEARGWDLPTLLRSHPDFCAGNDSWRLPTPKKTRKTMGLPLSD